MAFVPSRAHCLGTLTALALSTVPLLACSSGDDEDSAADGAESPMTTASSSSSETGIATSDETSTTTTTSAGTTTDDPPTTSVGATTSTTDEPTTDATTDADTGSSDDTGPICDPGQPNCVCDDGACIAGYACIMGVCGSGLECPGDVEPPVDSEDKPVELGDITDDDDDFLAQVGVLSGASDVDWYRLHGADTFGHTAEPTLTLIGGTQRNCVFLECDEGGVALTTLTCPAGSDFAISPMLRPGCCSTTTIAIKDFGCPGQDESMKMWLRFDKPASDICSDYDVEFHF